jgi:hypothetical protein
MPAYLNGDQYEMKVQFEFAGEQIKKHFERSWELGNEFPPSISYDAIPDDKIEERGKPTMFLSSPRLTSIANDDSTLKKLIFSKYVMICSIRATERWIEPNSPDRNQ